MGEEVQVLRLTEAALYANVARSTLHEATVRGELPCDEVLGRRAWYSDELDEWLASRGAKVKVKVAA